MRVSPGMADHKDKGSICSLTEYIGKIRAGGSCTVATPPVTEWVWAFIGCFFGIGVVSFLAFQKDVPVLVASLGASACLLYGAPAVPFAQPRNALAGHILSALIGVACYQFLGAHWYTMALSVGLAVATMVATRTIHPPAGATALIAVSTKQNWLFPLAPVGAGILILVIIAILVNNLAVKRRYPQYWW